MVVLSELPHSLQQFFLSVQINVYCALDDESQSMCRPSDIFNKTRGRELDAPSHKYMAIHLTIVHYKCCFSKEELRCTTQQVN